MTRRPAAASEPDDVTSASGRPPVGLPAWELSDVAERTRQLLLDGPPRYTRVQLCELAGVELAEATRLWRSLGFASVGDDEVVFTDADAESLRMVQRLQELGAADADILVTMSRLFGQTYARLAASQGQLFLSRLATRPELLADEDALLDTFAETVPVLEQLQRYVWRRQLAAYLTRLAAQAGGEPRTQELAELAVGFADITGFTSLTRRASEQELTELLETFEAVATEAVSGHGGRVIKTIGDEVLFVADDAHRAALIALELRDRTAEHEVLPPLRIGLAAGEVVMRLGDVFGSTVNIASRLTSLCRPGWILVDRVMADALRDDEQWWLKPRRPESVRGFSHLRPWRLRRADEQRTRAARAAHRVR